MLLALGALWLAQRDKKKKKNDGFDDEDESSEESFSDGDYDD